MFLPLILLWFPLMIFRTTAVEYRDRDLYCGYNTTNPTSNTTYYQNLKLVLDSLASDASIKEDKFFTSTFGNKTPDIAYGLYLCRADILPNDCRNCLREGCEYITKACPFSKEAVLWKDTCMLHYANHSMTFNKPAIFRKACNPKNNSNQALGKYNFWDEANKLMTQLAIEASNRETHKFAYNEFIYNGVEKFNRYVECRQDMSVSNLKYNPEINFS